MNIFGGANMSMAPGTQSLDSLFNLSGPAALPSGGMSFSPTAAPTFGFSNNFLPQGNAPSAGLNLSQFNALPQALPGGQSYAPGAAPQGFNSGAGLLAGALTQQQQQPAAPAAPPAANTDTGISRIVDTAKKFTSGVNDMVEKLFSPENKGLQQLVGAGLSAWGASKIADKQAESAEKISDKNRSNALEDRDWDRTNKLEDRDWEKDWQEQLLALQHQYALEREQANKRTIQFSGGATGPKLK